MGFRFGIDEVKDCLRSGQVQPAILDGTPRKFAWLGRTEAVHAAERLQKRRNNGPPAVTVKFGNILTGVTGLPREKEHQTGVYLTVIR